MDWLGRYRGSFTSLIIFVSVFLLAVVCIIVWLMLANAAEAGDIDRPCLTKSQAQAKWPGAWLYWHGLHKCWDNVSTRGRYAQRETQRVATWGKQNSLKLAKPNPDPNGNVTHHSGRPLIVDPPAGPTVAYPSLMPGAGTTPDMMRSDSMKGWPLIMGLRRGPAASSSRGISVSSFLNEQ